MNALAVVLELLAFQTLDGRVVLINTANIVSVSETSEVRKPQEKLLTDKVHCVINMTNGKFISVAEPCASVRQRLQEANK